MFNRSASILVTCLITLFTVAQAEPSTISQKQARKAISRVAGLNFEERAIKIDAVNATDAQRTSVTADVRVVFRAAKKSDAEWVVQEVRTGPGNWENVATIVQALRVLTPTSACSKIRSATLTSLDARCLIATLLGVPSPFDGVRIKELSPLNLPIGSQVSALIVSQLRLNFTLTRRSGEWNVSDVAASNGPRASLDGVHDSIDSLKRDKAKSDLALLAKALKSFHKDRGIFVVSDKGSVLIDHLSPRYLRSVIRLDPWHNPYQYHGDVASYSISSVGPDGKPNTPDDLVVTN